MKKVRKMMQPSDFKATIKRLGFTQTEFATTLLSNERTGQNWAMHGPPGPVEMLVRLLDERPELVDVLKRLSDKEAA